MTMWLDQKIAQLEEIVETCLALCSATQNGKRCTLPANHDPAQPHRFAAETFRQTQ